MRSMFLVILSLLAISGVRAGEAEVAAAQGVVDGQLRAFQAGDDALAYSFAAPGVKALFPTLESFTGMVAGGYQPVHRPKRFGLGKVEEMGAGRIAQQVFVTGPDGKEYEALYMLELQPDGSFKVTGVSLRASNSLGT